MILYSIIIPHYNSPDLLLRLLKTIPVREDLEVIVVDDNSTNFSNIVSLMWLLFIHKLMEALVRLAI